MSANLCRFETTLFPFWLLRSATQLFIYTGRLQFSPSYLFPVFAQLFNQNPFSSQGLMDVKLMKLI